MNKIIKRLIIIFILILMGYSLKSVNAVNWASTESYSISPTPCTKHENCETVTIRLRVSAARLEAAGLTSAYTTVHLKRNSSFTLVKDSQGNYWEDLIHYTTGLYCLEHNLQESNSKKFYIDYKFAIDGTNITVTQYKDDGINTYTGNKFYYGTKMAYILANSGADYYGTEDGVKRYKHYYSPVQWVLWEQKSGADASSIVLNKFFTKLGKLNDDMKNLGIGSYVSRDSGHTESEAADYGMKTVANNLDKDSEDYVNFIQNYKTVSITDDNKARIKVDTTSNAQNYIIGPININYTSALIRNKTVSGIDIGSCKLADKNGAEISSVNWGFYTISNGSYTQLTDTLPNGSDFYILISKSTDASKLSEIENIKIVEKKLNVKATFYAIGNYADAQQQFLVSNAERSYAYKSLYIPASIPVGDLEISKVDSDTSTKMNGVQFVIKNSAGYYITDVPTNGIAVLGTKNKAQAKVFTTGINGKTSNDGKIYIQGLVTGSYVIEETSIGSNFGYVVNTNSTSITINKGSNSTTIKNTKQTGNLLIQKVEEVTSARIAGMEFKIKNSSGKWLKINGSTGKLTGKILVSSYEEVEEANATTFVTDQNGEIGLYNLYAGTYTIKETSVGPNDYYGLKETTDNITVVRQTSNQTTSTSSNSVSNITIRNKRKYIDITGKVWEDKYQGKESGYNNLYDEKDTLVQGIEVRLIKNDGTVAITQTGSDGSYKFEKLLIDDILNNRYYIEFEYNGMKYESIPLVNDYVSNINASKAADTIRDNINNNFNTIDSGNAQGIEYNTANHKSEVVYRLESEVDSTRYSENYYAQGMYHVTASTNKASYNISSGYNPNDAKQISIEVNFGIRLREQPDLSVVKDIENIRVEVNGTSHTYSYASRYVNESGDEEFDVANSGFDIGVKFGEKYGTQSYTRYIYKSDYDFDGSNQLKMYITYKIAIRNDSGALTTKVNTILEYYDYRLNNPIVSRKIDQNGKVVESDSIEFQTDESPSENYKKIILNNVNKTIEPNKIENVYIQFELDKETAKNLAEGNYAVDNQLSNIAEIESYTTYDAGGLLYGGIDRDSRPGNSNITSRDTFEDDTDAAPGLKIMYAAPRATQGTMFEDASVFSEENTNPAGLNSGKERLGNGTYDEGENTIGGVEVKLTPTNDGDGKYTYITKSVEEDGTYKVETTTNEADKTKEILLTKEASSENSGQDGYVDLKKGDYYIEGYIPDTYTLSYTWGDQTYTVQNYKSTTVDEDKWNEYEVNNEWYKIEPNTRLSDAIDNWDMRQQIDNQTKSLTNGTYQDYENTYNGTDNKLIDKITAQTQEFVVHIEYDAAPSNGAQEQTTNNGVNKISNIDLGITLRPKQELKLEKVIKNIQIVLANGETIISADVKEDENGNRYIDKDIKYLNYLPGTIASDATIKAEMDNELIQGANLKLNYEFTITNISEIDYGIRNYYWFGKIGTNDELVKLMPKQIIDYLEGEAQITDSNWNIKTSSEKIELIEDKYLTKDLKATLEKLDTVATYNIQDVILKPGESNKVAELSVEKLLSNTNEIDVNNQTEIIESEKTSGSMLVATPGNYNPVTEENHENDDYKAEEVIITPPTGKNLNYIAFATGGIVILIIATTGLVIIHKKKQN